MEASYIEKGFRSNLTSILYPPTSGRCFQFWYHMYGSAMGSLQLFLLQKTGENILWSELGDHGNQWINHSVEFSSLTTYRIRFTATAASSYRRFLGDMALDNLFFAKGSCDGKKIKIFK